MELTRTFTVTVTTACETSQFTAPILPAAFFYTLDDVNREVLAVDTLRDDISRLAVDSHGRSTSAVPFCGELPSSLVVNSFAPTIVDTSSDPTGRTTTYDLA